MKAAMSICFAVLPQIASFCIPFSRCHSMTILAVPRYGPTTSINEDPEEEQANWERQETQRVAQQEINFQNLLDKVLSTTKAEHLPGLMTKNLELLLRMRGYEGVELINNAIEKARETKGEERAEEVMAAIEFMLSFTEEFVDQAKAMDDTYKALLGKIIRAMTDNKDTLSVREQEEYFDLVMQSEKDNFSPGFLKHVDGECERISNAPTMTPESSRLLEIIRIIQTRLLEELGKDIGEGALVLGQLMGYDDTEERLAVLETGLTVRGLDFAKEMAALTGEALRGFQTVPGGADPELVERIQEMDDRIQAFIDAADVLQ